MNESSTSMVAMTPVLPREICCHWVGHALRAPVTAPDRIFPAGQLRRLARMRLALPSAALIPEPAAFDSEEPANCGEDQIRSRSHHAWSSPRREVGPWP